MSKRQPLPICSDCEHCMQPKKMLPRWLWPDEPTAWCCAGMRLAGNTEWNSGHGLPCWKMRTDGACGVGAILFEPKSTTRGNKVATTMNAWKCNQCGHGYNGPQRPCPECSKAMGFAVNYYPAIRYRKIYVASSWRNPMQADVVKALHLDGHLVYDFKNPRPGDRGFSWSEIDPQWQKWTAKQYVAALDHPIAKRGFASDFNAMKWADTFLLVLPCGRSAHLELGWAAGAGKQTLILTRDGEEPELMAKMCDHICTSLDEARTILAG